VVIQFLQQVCDACVCCQHKFIMAEQTLFPQAYQGGEGAAGGEPAGTHGFVGAAPHLADAFDALLTAEGNWPLAPASAEPTSTTSYKARIPPAACIWVRDPNNCTEVAILQVSPTIDTKEDRACRNT
jgi:hypothetical protein